MNLDLNALHYVFLVFTILILVVMIRRRDTTFVSILGIFLIALVATNSISTGLMTIFNSFIFAITELLGTILIISVIVGMSTILKESGISEVMIGPLENW